MVALIPTKDVVPKVKVPRDCGLIKQTKLCTGTNIMRTVTKMIYPVA